MSSRAAGDDRLSGTRSEALRVAAGSVRFKTRPPAAPSLDSKARQTSAETTSKFNESQAGWSADPSQRNGSLHYRSAPSPLFRGDQLAAGHLMHQSFGTPPRRRIVLRHLTASAAGPVAPASPAVSPAHSAGASPASASTSASPPGLRTDSLASRHRLVQSVKAPSGHTPPPSSLESVKCSRNTTQPPASTARPHPLDGGASPAKGRAGRKPRRKAVVVGINYAFCGPIRLRGCVNDAHLFALALVNLFDFHPNNVLLLTDELPSDERLISEEDRLKRDISLTRYYPERSHIVLGLKWLISEAQPGDCLVFYFAGHGLQLDNMAGWEGEGYDEAILPLDCAHGSGEVNAIPAVNIRQLLMSVNEKVQVTVILDCNGGQTMMDVSGTGSWSFVKGVVQRGWWPFVTDPADKMLRARYDQNVWTDSAMQAKGVRPRFVPGVEVGNVADLADAMPGLKSLGDSPSKAHGYLLVAAPFSQVALEGSVPPFSLASVLANGKPCKQPLWSGGGAAHHGLFTWALVRAMNSAILNSVKSLQGDKKVSFRALEKGTSENIQELREKRGFPCVDQEPSLTFFVSSGSDTADYIFYPFGGRAKSRRYIDATEEFMKKRKGPWVPAREEYVDAWQAEKALCAYGKVVEQSKSFLNIKDELETDWKSKYREKLVGFPLI